MDPEFLEDPFHNPVCRYAEYYLLRFLAEQISLGKGCKDHLSKAAVGNISCDVLTKNYGKQTRLVITSQNGNFDGCLLDDVNFGPFASPLPLRTLHSRSLGQMGDKLFGKVHASLYPLGISITPESNMVDISINLLNRCGLKTGKNFRRNIKRYSRHLDQYFTTDF